MENERKFFQLEKQLQNFETISEKEIQELDHELLELEKNKKILKNQHE